MLLEGHYYTELGGAEAHGLALETEGSLLFVKFLDSRLILILHYLLVSLPSLTRVGWSELGYPLVVVETKL